MVVPIWYPDGFVCAHTRFVHLYRGVVGVAGAAGGVAGAAGALRVAKAISLNLCHPAKSKKTNS